MSKPMTHELDNPEIKKLLNDIAIRIGTEIPEGWGFTLLIFEFDPGNSLFYISNAQRQQMVKVMREFIQRYGEN